MLGSSHATDEQAGLPDSGAFAEGVPVNVSKPGATSLPLWRVGSIGERSPIGVLSCMMRTSSSEGESLPAMLSLTRSYRVHVRRQGEAGLG